jgi:hypothetical protein
MRVNYRSAICKHIRIGTQGEPVELDGFNSEEVDFVRQGEKNLVYAEAALDGRSDCKWELSNISFGIAYADISEFDRDISYSGARGMVISFDHRPPLMRSGNTKTILGNVSIIEDFYPWIDEEFIGKYEKSVRRAGRGALYKNYLAQQACEVYVEVFLHCDYPVYSSGPKTQSIGNRTVFNYTVGSVSAEKILEPSFQKLQNIRLGITAEQTNTSSTKNKEQ